jgi:hypothetical protein
MDSDSLDVLPGQQMRKALTTREAALYCGCSSPAGLLSARRRGEVDANGRRIGSRSVRERSRNARCVREAT